jgi:hypothetical protein
MHACIRTHATPRTHAWHRGRARVSERCAQHVNLAPGTGCWLFVPELCTPGAAAAAGRSCRQPALICKARPPFELAPGVSDGVCVCVCVCACVCVCMCASCFIIITTTTHTAPCWPSRRRHYARLGKCQCPPELGGSSNAGDRACAGPLHLRDIPKRLGACSACVWARHLGATCAGAGTRHKRGSWFRYTPGFPPPNVGRRKDGGGRRPPRGDT